MDCEVANALISFLETASWPVAGLALWRAGIVHFRSDFGIRAWLDIVVLVAIMDLAMYLLHRVAHTKLFYPLLHASITSTNARVR